MMSCVSSVAADAYDNITAELGVFQQLLEQGSLSDEQLLSIQDQLGDLELSVSRATTLGELTQEQYREIAKMIQNVRDLFPKERGERDPSGGSPGILLPVVDDCEEGGCECPEEECGERPLLLE